MASTTADAMSGSQVTDPELTKAIIQSIDNGLTMCGATATCVGVSSIPGRDVGSITGLIGVHGKVSGFTTINMSEALAVKMVEGLLQDDFGKLTTQVVDGAGELTNIIVGGIKSNLAGTKWSFSNMTVPSVIIGHGYRIAYAHGLDFVCATFEVANTDAVMLEDRLLQVSISLLCL